MIPCDISMDRTPLVSILCTAYNHGAYIRHTLEGFLSQRVTFPYEVIVHDDASTDTTQAMIRAHEEEHPGIIRGIYQVENQHSIARGRVAEILYSSARGKYIALCEGDDQWIDPDKLQRQVDALEADDQAMGCFTDAYNERNGERVRYMAGYGHAPTGLVGQAEIIAGQGIPTCTFIFRRIPLEGFYALRKISPVGDTILFTYLTEHGHFIYQPQITGVRVMHPGGIHSLTSEAHKKKVYLTTLPILDKMTHGRHRAIIEDRRNSVLLAAWSAAIAAGDRELARIAWPHIARQRKRFGWNITTTARNFMKAYFPALESTFSRIFRR